MIKYTTVLNGNLLHREKKKHKKIPTGKKGQPQKQHESIQLSINSIYCFFNVLKKNKNESHQMAKQKYTHKKIN